MLAAVCHSTLHVIALACAVSRPPALVETSPSHGQAGVDPATREIVARFDTPMGPGFSWVGGGPMFPEVTAPARWIDRATASLPVRLEPDHDYVIGLNGGSYQNFRSASGVALEPMQVAFSTRELPTSPDTNRRAFERLLDAVVHHYSHRDRLGVDWEEHLAAWREEIVASDSTLRLAVRVSEALGAAEDIHVSVRHEPWVLGTHRAGAEPNFDFAVADLCVDGLQRRGNGVFSARMEDGTAYLLVTTWDAGADPGPASVRALRDNARRAAIDH